MNKLYTKDHFWLEKVVPDSPIRGAILPRLNQENLYIFGATEHGIHELGIDGGAGQVPQGPQEERADSHVRSNRCGPGGDECQAQAEGDTD